MISNRFYDKKTGQADNVGLYCFLKKKRWIICWAYYAFFYIKFHEINNIKIC
jgi:hypothetical protein